MSSSCAGGWKQGRQFGGGVSGRRASEQQHRTRRRVSAAPSRSSLGGLLVSLVLSSGVVGRASGWNDCVVSPEDEWKPARERSPAMRMRYDYQRRYTCDNVKASFVASSFYFVSPCMPKSFFYPPDVHACLRGRRMIFLGDSLSNQQGDSLLGMLGWHPEWMTKGAPKNQKQAVGRSGTKYNTMVDCWHPETGGVIGTERCYDYSSKDFPRPTASKKPPIGVKGRDHHGRRASALEVAVELDDEGEGAGHGGEEGGDEEEEEEFSVHMRMFSYPQGDNWFNTALLDYNDTRASDVIVVNFGAHYHFSREDEARFKADVAPILDAMGELGDKATVVWREIGPTHFPAQNGTYDAFMKLTPRVRRNRPCCTGTPPRVLDRNAWVENYLREHGLADKVKLLRVYNMSWARGAAHHSCNLAPPSTMDQSKARSSVCLRHGGLDCVHWSETGVVEEWNGLLLNHICGSPAVA